MNARRQSARRKRPVTGLVALLALLAGRAFAGELPTQSFRDEHAGVLVHLGHVESWIGELAGQEPAGRRESAGRIHGFFDREIRPHAEWEEANLYPVIDRLAGTTADNRLTATMRHEHRIVGRWIEELAKELAKPEPDYTAFARRSDRLLGLILAHFEEEEEVLLPYADRQMSRAEFEAAVPLGKGGHQH